MEAIIGRKTSFIHIIPLHSAKLCYNNPKSKAISCSTFILMKGFNAPPLGTNHYIAHVLRETEVDALQPLLRGSSLISDKVFWKCLWRRILAYTFLKRSRSNVP